MRRGMKTVMNDKSSNRKPFVIIKTEREDNSGYNWQLACQRVIIMMMGNGDGGKGAKVEAKVLSV